MQLILSGICLAAAVCLEPPAAEYAAPDDYGLRSKSWRLDDGAKRLLAEWGATPYVRKAGRTDIFVRAQLKYGINRDDFIHHWYDRPLLQDSTLGQRQASAPTQDFEGHNRPSPPPRLPPTARPKRRSQT